MAGELESCKTLSGLLSGLAQEAFHGHSGITEELLRSQLYPEVPLEEFRPFLAKMRGILKVPLLPAASAGAFTRLPHTGEKTFLSDLCFMSSTLRSLRIWALVLSSDFLKGDPFLLKLPVPSAVDRHPPERNLGIFPKYFTVVV